METSNIPNDFSDLQHWSSNDNLDLHDAADMIYCPSNFPSARSSLSCEAARADHEARRHPYHTFNHSSGSVDSPNNATPRYQLPSPEEEVVVDAVFVDKERRREQNRVAQRAFRERKETKLRQLEKQIGKLKADQRQLERKYHNLCTAHLRLQSGLKILLEASGTFDDFEPIAASFDADIKG